MNELPTMAEQTNSMLLKEPNAFSTYNEKTKAFKAADDLFWKQVCFERFSWTKRASDYGHQKLTPAQLA